MKGTDRSRMLGAVVGKALGPLREDKRVIPGSRHLAIGPDWFVDAGGRNCVPVREASAIGFKQK